MRNVFIIDGVVSQMRFTAHQYQIAAARFLAKNPYSALYADPGTGKTAIMLMLVHAMKKAGKLSTCLVTAPLRIATSTWPDEIHKWDQFAGITFEILRGAKKDTIVKHKADIHIINNEGLDWLTKSGHFENYKMLIIDESSKFKNWTAKRTNILKSFSKQFERRHVLTGSPAPRSLLDIFAQQYLADAGRSLGRYITHYRERYFTDKGYIYPDWQLNEGAEEKIYKAIAPSCYRLDGGLLLDMPELIVNDIYIELPLKLRKLSYEALSAIGVNVGLSAAGEYAIARQIAGGFSASGGKIHDHKISALRDLLDELQGKNAIVFFYYREEGKALSAAFGNAPRIDGGTSASTSSEIMSKWNRGAIPLLLLHPAAAGHGLNLQAGGNDVIWFSYTDNQDDYYQAIRRVYRQGVKGNVRVHRLIAKGTIDEAMIKSLEAKTAQQKALLDAVRELQETGSCCLQKALSRDLDLMTKGFHRVDPPETEESILQKALNRDMALLTKGFLRVE